MPRSSQMGQVNQMPIRPLQPTNQPVGPGFDSMVNRTERFDPALPPPQMADYQSSKTQELFKEAQDRRDMSKHAMPKPSFNNKQTQDVAMTEDDAKNLSRSFYKYALPESAGEVLTFGQLIRSMKNDLNSTGISATNKLKFTLLGDPALKLPIPQLNIVVTEILNPNTNEQIDTLNALLGSKKNSQDNRLVAKGYDFSPL